MRTWFVTGSSKGLGRMLCEEALEAGDQVVATARDAEAVTGLRQRFGAAVLPVKLDVTDRTEAEAAVRAAIETFGAIDVLVNNAGYANVAPFEEMPPEDFRRQVEANFMGVVNVTRAALPAMRSRHSGHIIQVSSIGGRLGTPGLSAYQAAKWAVGGFSEVLAAEVRHLGIHVTVLEPGGMRTEWARSSMTVHPVGNDYMESVGPWTRLFEAAQGRPADSPVRPGGPMDPREVARLILRLAALPEPPLRLVVGSTAIASAEQASAARAAEDAAWKELGLSAEQ